MSKYIKRLPIGILCVFFVSCQDTFIQTNETTFDPEIKNRITILEGKFGILDLFEIDSVPSNQTITIESELIDSKFNLSTIIPADSTYSAGTTLLNPTQTFGINNHGSLSTSLNQLTFVQYFSPTDFNLFNNNNGSNISWSGCNSFNNYYFSPVSVPEVFGSVHIDSGEYEVTLVNNFDFDLTLGVSLKSNPSILFSQVVYLPSGDSTSFVINVNNQDANAWYNWTIYQASSTGISSSLVVLDNSSLLEMKVSRNTTSLSSGKFRPISNLISQESYNLDLPISNKKYFYFLEGGNLFIDNIVNATGLGNTNLKLHRSIFDLNGVLYEDSLNVVSTSAVINWNIPLSNLPIHTIDGTIEIEYSLTTAVNSIIELSPNKLVGMVHGFQNSPELISLGVNEDLIFVDSNSAKPYDAFPAELNFDFIPNPSQIENHISHLGWGVIEIETEYNNNIGGIYKDSVLYNAGNSYLDTGINKTLSWTLGNPEINALNTLSLDSVNAYTKVTFKKPWGFRVGSNTRYGSNARTSLSSNTGSAILHSQKLLDISSNNKLDSLLASCDSISITASILSKSQNNVYNTFSLVDLGGSDSLISLNKILLSKEERYSKSNTVIDPFILNNLLKWEYKVDFASPSINLKSSDSLFLDLSLKTYGIP